MDQRVLLGPLGLQGRESGLLLLLQEAAENLKLLPDAFLRVLALVLGRDGTRCVSTAFWPGPGRAGPARCS